MKQANNIIRIPTSIDGKFFRYWFEFLKPFHQLTDREAEIVACFIKHRYLLSKVISDSDILDKVLMGEDTKKKVCEECNISTTHLQVLISKFRKNGIIINNKINPRFIPNITAEKGPFNLLIFFDLQ